MINTIIFDFGDVFINLDKEATFRELAKLGVTEITQEMLQIAQQYEEGAISTQKFVDHFTQQFHHIASEDLIAAWNAIILDFPEYRLEFIEELAASKKYTLILLSNTNTLHIEKVIENMSLERYERFKKCFHSFYLSHEIGFRKPNADIFEFVLNENNLKANHCLFIDDTEEHTLGASQLGIHTLHLLPSHDITNLFDLKKALF